VEEIVASGFGHISERGIGPAKAENGDDRDLAAALWTEPPLDLLRYTFASLFGHRPPTAMLRLVSSISRPATTGRLSSAVCTSCSASSSGTCPTPKLFSCKTKFSISTRIARRNFSTTNARQADITLTVDGKEVTVPQGECALGADRSGIGRVTSLLS
jgi:hypothetical protein